MSFDSILRKSDAEDARKARRLIAKAIELASTIQSAPDDELDALKRILREVSLLV